MKRWHLIIASALIAIPIEALSDWPWTAVVAQLAFMIGVDLGYLVAKWERKPPLELPKQRYWRAP